MVEQTLRLGFSAASSAPHRNRYRLTLRKSRRSMRLKDDHVLTAAG
jgi:hypothetical protein